MRALPLVKERNSNLEAVKLYTTFDTFHPLTTPTNVPNSTFLHPAI